jgi:acetate---CoA ligase (ADP-forming)
MDLRFLFSPTSVAIIGASTKPGSVGNTLTENLIRNGYSGPIYPVNPKADTLFGLTCYKSISTTPEHVDLAVIIVPAAAVLAVFQEAAVKGIRSAIIISSGFKETGPEGRKLEEEIAAVAAEHHIALLGPNCLGLINPKIGLNVSFAKLMPAAGHIAFFSQSGALCTAVLDIVGKNIGFSSFVSIGNKAALNENDLLRFYAQDEESEVLTFYTEGLVDSAKLIETGRGILTRPEAKPIIALKSGTTAAGTQATSSHTGALAGNDTAYQALFKQARIIRAESLEDLLNLATIFSKNKLPKGNRLAIVTNAGGLGVLATDAAVLHGLEVTALSPETEAHLKEILPSAASTHNPVDVLGDALADRYAAALDAVAADSRADSIMVIVTPQTTTQAIETAQAIIDTRKKTEKPLVAVFSGDISLRESITLLEEHGVATVAYPELGAQMLAASARVTRWRNTYSATPFSFDDIDRERAAAVFAQARTEGRAALYEAEAAEIFKAYGFPFLDMRFVRDAQQADEAGQAINRPLALKIVSPDISHKSDVGGVLLNILPEDAASAYHQLMEQVGQNAPEARLEGALITEMAQSNGYEIILGMKKEPGLGNLVMVGLGGIYVETFKDVAFRFSPLTQEDADEMLHELKSYPLFTGTRGKQGIDLDMLRSLIGRLSQLAVDFPEIEELDINPVLAFPEAEAFRTLDARIRITI